MIGHGILSFSRIFGIEENAPLHKADPDQIAAAGQRSLFLGHNFCIFQIIWWQTWGVIIIGAAFQCPMQICRLIFQRFTRRELILVTHQFVVRLST
jgi:hypothetical protein